MSVPHFGLNDAAERLTAKAVFAVEATGFEFEHLCKTHHLDREGECWNGGGMVYVGSLWTDKGRKARELPVNVEVRFAKIRGQVVMFYEPCSRAVDHDLVRAWLDERGFPGPSKRCGAQDFYLAERHVNQLVEQAKETVARAGGVL